MFRPEITQLTNLRSRLCGHHFLNLKMTILTRDQPPKTYTLEILGYLEKYGILGEIASVDVSGLGNIQLMYGDRFRIDLGDQKDLEKKISYAVAAIAEMESHRTGVIDVSFTVKPDQPVFTPYAD